MTTISTTEWQDYPEGSAQIGNAVRAAVDDLWKSDDVRRTRMLDGISRYENCRYDSVDVAMLQSLSPYKTADGADLCWNMTRSLVNTAVAQFAAQQPKVKSVCSDADWSVRRKAKKLDAFVEGLWSIRQEPYADIWELASYVLRDMMVCQEGYVRTDADQLPGSVRNTRLLPWEVLWDPIDARDGKPRHVFFRYYQDLAELIARYPDQEKALRAAVETIGFDDAVGMNYQVARYTGRSTVSDQVVLYEWISLPISGEIPGRRVLCCDGGAVLIDRPWERVRFPIASIFGDRRFVGSGAISLVEQVAAIDDEINDLVTRISRATRYTSMAVVYRRIGSTSVTNINDDDCITVDYEGAEPGMKVESPEPCSPTHIDLIKMHEDAAYRYSGISQMTATAQKPTGVEAGVALRLLKDQQSERLSMMLSAYQSLFVDIAYNSIACVRELAEEDTNFAAKWAGNGFLRTINWQSVELDEDKFVFQIAKVSGIKGTPADRAQAASEYFAQGLISQDAYASVMSSLDTPGALDEITRQRQIIDDYIEGWLDATPDEIASGYFADGHPVFTPPIRWLPRLEDALLQVADAYLQATLDRAPEENLELFTRFMEMLDQLIEQKQVRMQQLQQQQQQGASL